MAAFLAACGPKQVLLEVDNRSDLARVGETVGVDYNRIEELLPTSDTALGLVVYDPEGNEVPSQYTDIFGELLFQVDVAANSKVNYTVRRGKPSLYAQKVYGRLVPERKDDWAWENDRVAHRIYGPALEATGELSNGVDVWLKSTPELVVNQWYQPGVDYHTDRGQGLDSYKVGRTLGGGALAPVVDTAFVLGNNFIEAECIDNGPIRHTVRVHYAPYVVGGKKLIETRTISLDAGSHFNRVAVEFVGDVFDSLPVAAGIVLREGGAVQSTDTWLAYSEPEAAPNGRTYLGLIMGGPSTPDTIQNHAVMRSFSRYAEPNWYFFGSGWSKGVDGGFATPEAWEAFVAQQAAKIADPIMVTIKE